MLKTKALDMLETKKLDMLEINSLDMLKAKTIDMLKQIPLACQNKSHRLVKTKTLGHDKNEIHSHVGNKKY